MIKVGGMDASRDECNMAALAQSVGIVAALPVWLWWRNRSAFVRAHAAQSMAFDGVTTTALVIVAALTVGVAVAGNTSLSALPGNSKDIALLLLVAVCAPGLALVGFLAVLVVALLLRLRAAIAANQGKPFCYPLMGKKTSEVSETWEVKRT